MRVCYVTMQFPAPWETFAGSDLRWLGEHGVTANFDLDSSCRRYVESWRRAEQRMRPRDRSHAEPGQELVAS